MSDERKSEPKALSIAGKLAAVMGAVGWVEKSGVNQFHKYKYATEAGIVDAVRGAMANHGLMLVPSIASSEWVETKNAAGKTERICRIKVHYRILDSDSPSVIEFEMVGEGQDSGDKAFYKALTGATKYALLKLFLIPTGGEPEDDVAPSRSRPPSRPTVKTESAPASEMEPGSDIGEEFEPTECREILARIESASSVAALKALVGDAAKLPEPEKTMVRAAYATKRAALDVLISYVKGVI